MSTLGNNSLHWLHVGLNNGSNAGLDVLKLENIESKDIIFSKHGEDNEPGKGGVESYRGGWRDDQPEGEGRYTWSDGSTYEGSWMSGQKHGWGKYSWPSGATYLGEWKHGSLHGYGTFHSPDGSKYQGNWENNLKDGIGTKWLANGDRHEGLYVQDKPHGPGRYLFASGDEFDGEFREGKFHGQGTFKWVSKHRYDGEWCHGMKHGIGVFTWPDGSTYEGFWQHGLQDGVGVFRPARRRNTTTNSSTNNNETNKTAATHGASVSAIVGAPAAAAAAGAHIAASAFHQLADHGAKLKQTMHASGFSPPSPIPKPPHGSFTPVQSPPGTCPGSPTSPAAPTSPSATAVPADAALAPGLSNSAATPKNFHHQHKTSTSSNQNSKNHNNTNAAASAAAVYACEYRLGELILEEALQPEDLDYVFGTASRSRKFTGSAINGTTTNTTTTAAATAGGANTGAWKLMARQSLVRHRRPKKEERMGETIFKGSPSFDLMLNLQLGIRYTLTTLSRYNLTGPLEKAHFEEKVWLRFPRQGSEVTPPHPSNDFKWKDYAPIVFRQLRGLFGISNSEYILSTCGDHALREMQSPGKSGSVFFVSQDERFLIKTMRKEEVKLLLRTLPLYYAHVASHPDTLISRFYGVHRITLASTGRKVRFVVLNNIFATEMPLHKKYDLKGSTYKRTAGDVVHTATTSSTTALATTATTGSSSATATAAVIFKDLDLQTAFQLKKPVVERLQRQLAADAAFLQSADVMDYSLLLGVHFRGRKDPVAGAAAGGGGGAAGELETQQKGKVGAKINKNSGASPLSPNSAAAAPTNLSAPEESNIDLMTPVSSGALPSRPSSAVGTQQATPSLHSGDGVNVAGYVDDVDDTVPLVIHNSHSFSAKKAATLLQKQQQQQQQQPEPLQVLPLGIARARINLGLNRFKLWRRDKKEKKRQKAEQASGVGKVALAPPPTPSPPLSLEQLNHLGSSTAVNSSSIQQESGSGLFSSPSSLSSSSGAVAPAFFMGHRRTTSATAALGSTSLFSSPAAGFHLGIAGSSSTAPSSPVIGGVQRPGSGPLVRTASARTAAAGGGTKNNNNARGQHHHLKVTYSEQLIEQHAALVASLANWGNDANTKVVTGTGDRKVQLGSGNGNTNNTIEDTITTVTPTKPSVKRVDSSTNDENTTLNNTSSLEEHIERNHTINYRADAAALPVDSSVVEPTTPSSARVSNVFTRNLSNTGGELFSTSFPMQSPPLKAQQNVPNAAGVGVGVVAVGQEEEAGVPTTTITTTAAAPSPLHKDNEEEDVNRLHQSISMSITEAFDDFCLDDEEAQALVSRLTNRLSKPIEERLAFDLLRLARHKMLGGGSGRANGGPSSSERLPTAVLAAARHARFAHNTSLDRKGLEGNPASLETATATVGVATTPVAPLQQQQQQLREQQQQVMEHVQSLSRDVPAIAVPLDPTPGILSAHTVPSSGTDADNDQDVALFLGVIDWLQPYNARKRLEHGFKSVVLDSRAISVCEPRAYAKRFLNLMTKLFVAEPDAAGGS